MIRIVVVDDHELIQNISLPGHDGAEGLSVMRSQFPDIPFLVLSVYPEERYPVRALQAGAADYITKSMAAEAADQGNTENSSHRKIDEHCMIVSENKRHPLRKNCVR